MENYTKKQVELIEKNLTSVDTESLFNEFLDESESITILGMSYSISTVLKEVDPTAYRCCLNDFIDGMINDTLTDEINGEHYDLGDVTQLLNDDENEDD